MRRGLPTLPAVAARAPARPGRLSGSGGRRVPPRCESGGAASLWVIILVPVLIYGALAAMAVPERMAAEATVDDVALDLATLAVAWRVIEEVPQGEIDSFIPDCVSDVDEIREFECRSLWRPVVMDLGLRGVDVTSLRGFYSDLYSTASDGETRPPCVRTNAAVVLDAVHVAIVADWYGSWAATQVWPDGQRQGAEAVSRLQTSFVDATPGGSLAETLDSCGGRFELREIDGSPVWWEDPEAPGRRMAQSIPLRTTFGHPPIPPLY